jgi:5-methylcytosine-specific restriction endonuclease McrA
MNNKIISSSKKWKLKNPEKVRAYQIKWFANNQDKKILYEKKYRDKRKKDTYKQMKHQKNTNESAVRLRIRQKLMTIEKYGGKCSYCGEKRYELLCIDHVNDNGAEHRRIRKTRKSLWNVLCNKECFPKEYQLLCFNCNTAKSTYGIKPGGNKYKSEDEWKELSKLREVHQFKKAGKTEGQYV